ncbi:MAG: transketolase C-terminal domain-containing protein [Candidatus Omnitrophota bacterium]
MARTVAETIKEITRGHLTKNNGLLLGQAITAVGWVNNTVPDCKGIIELSMADVSGSGIAVGAALAGRRPIFVIRFQDFLILNGSPLIYYAAKTKEFFGKGTPIFVRAIASEGKGAGPVHSGKLHSIFMHFPGFRVSAPVTPKEYETAWKDFLEHDDPAIVCEHRASFDNKDEIADRVTGRSDVTIYAISIARFNAVRAAELLERDGIKCDVVNIVRLKPFLLNDRLLGPLKSSKMGIVVDTGFEPAGASQSIAYELMFAAGVPVKALGLADRSVGVTPGTENSTPDARRIAEAVRTEYGKRRGR